MLTDILRVMINNPFKENFYVKIKKKKKNTIYVLTAFFISHKSNVKIFFN